MTVEERHRAATAEFTAATAAYESALISGDEDAIAATDARLTAADRTYSETLAAVVHDGDAAARCSLPSEFRRSLPSFIDMLAHPWCQPAEPTGTIATAVVYGEAVAQTAGLPVLASAAALAGTNPGRYESEAWEAAYRDLFETTGDRRARVG